MIDGLGHRVRQTAGTDVVNQQNGIVVAHLPATIDNFLRAALNFRITALHGRKIKILATDSARDTGRRPTAKADQHRRPADDRDLCSNRHVDLGRVAIAHIANTAGDHDGFVIAANFIIGQARQATFEGSKIAQQVRPPEFVVECGAADGPFDHDVERLRDSVRMRKIDFPRLLEAGNSKVRHGKSRQPCFWLGAEARCAFVANLTAGSGCRTRKRRNRGWVVVSFDLHQDMHGFVAVVIFATAVSRHQSQSGPALDNRSIVRVGGDNTLRACFCRRANHAEQAFHFWFTIDDPVSIKNLVTTMFGVCLRKHHQLSVGRIAVE